MRDDSSKDCKKDQQTGRKWWLGWDFQGYHISWVEFLYESHLLKKQKDQKQ